MSAPAIRVMPAELLNHAFSFLSADDLVQASSVSQRWKTAANDRKLWQALFPAICPGQQLVRSKAALLNRVKRFLPTVQLNQTAEIECFFQNETKRRILGYLWLSPDAATKNYPLVSLKCRIVTGLSQEDLHPCPSKHHENTSDFTGVTGFFPEKHLVLTNDALEFVKDMMPTCRASFQIGDAILRMMQARRDEYIAQTRRPLYIRLVIVAAAALIIAYKTLRD